MLFDLHKNPRLSSSNFCVIAEVTDGQSNDGQTIRSCKRGKLKGYVMLAQGDAFPLADNTSHMHYILFKSPQYYDVLPCILDKRRD